MDEHKVPMVTFALKGPAKEWWNGVLTEVDARMRPKVSS